MPHCKLPKHSLTPSIKWHTLLYILAGKHRCVESWGITAEREIKTEAQTPHLTEVRLPPQKWLSWDHTASYGQSSPTNLAVSICSLCCPGYTSHGNTDHCKESIQRNCIHPQRPAFVSPESKFHLLSFALKRPNNVHGPRPGHLRAPLFLPHTSGEASIGWLLICARAHPRYLTRASQFMLKNLILGEVCLLRTI